MVHGAQKVRAAVLSLRTGERKNILEDAFYPRYLPTGHLVFTRGGALYAAPFSLQRLETTGPPIPLLEDLLTNRYTVDSAEFAYSRDGTLVYVPYRQPQRTLVWVDRRGATERTPFQPTGYQWVALSPDGGRLAANSIGKGEAETLLFGDFVRGTLTPSVAEGPFSNLVWAPDGKRLAFSCGCGGTIFAVFWQKADGSGAPERLGSESTAQQEHPTSFSPDGSALLVQVFNYTHVNPAQTRWETYVLPLSGERKLRPFLRTKFNVRNARFAPDGRWVSYQSNESGRTEVYVQAYPPPGPKWQISADGGGDARWSRKGRELFYRQGDRMMVVDVETKPTFRPGRPRILFEGQFLDSDYDVTPEGTRFLMIKPDPAESGPAQVKVVLNWFEEVRRRVPGAK
jgi:hypothetical protein